MTVRRQDTQEISTTGIREVLSVIWEVPLDIGEVLWKSGDLGQYAEEEESK